MIYVDSTHLYPQSSLFSKYWCHMFTDGTVAELHAMAGRLGLSRVWFINNPYLPYYDLVPAKRRLALELGAEEIAKERLREMLTQMGSVPKNGGGSLHVTDTTSK